jgi:hypothetical protein
MTKFFYDTEFLDDGVTINFISIGIVREDGVTYYAVNADADWDRIHENSWLMANVVQQLPPKATWKPKTVIADEVRAFLLGSSRPELWAWFASYDHVVLSQLFGRMLDLPTGIPMFTNDLRSLIDLAGIRKLPEQTVGNHDALEDAKHLKVRFDYVAEQMSINSIEQKAAKS